MLMPMRAAPVYARNLPGIPRLSGPAATSFAIADGQGNDLFPVHCAPPSSPRVRPWPVQTATLPR